MAAFYSDIQRIGQVAKSKPLSYNVIRWTAHSVYYSVKFRTLSSKEGDQRFQMTGSPAQVFDLSLQTARILGPLGYGNWQLYCIIVLRIWIVVFSLSGRFKSGVSLSKNHLPMVLPCLKYPTCILATCTYYMQRGRFLNGCIDVFCLGIARWFPTRRTIVELH